MGKRMSQKNNAKPVNEIEVRRAARADVKILVSFAKKEILKASHYNIAARQAYSLEVGILYEKVQKSKLYNDNLLYLK